MNASSVQMEFSTLKDALDGFYAYDSGSLDSGIRDESLRTQVQKYLASLDEKQRKALLAKAARELYLSDEAIAQGYGLCDIALFYDWLMDVGWMDMDDLSV